MQLVARGGGAAPGGGTFGQLGGPAINGRDQLAFLAEVGPTGTGVEGLFFFDSELGLRAVAREGDALLGSTIVGIDFGPDDGLNDAGQIAYAFDLADGTAGVAIWTVPEPAALGVLAAAGLLLRRSPKPRV